MEDAYLTKTPMYTTIVVLATFVFTSLVFFAYDWLVERRQRIVMRKAVQSTEVVQSLFPENVRKRLFEEQGAEQKNATSAKTELHNMKQQPREDMENGKMTSIADVYEHCTVFFGDLGKISLALSALLSTTGTCLLWILNQLLPSLVLSGLYPMVRWTRAQRYLPLTRDVVQCIRQVRIAIQ
jgi:hypothetical protein